MKEPYAGYDLSDDYKRLTVMHFDAAGQLQSILKYKAPPKKTRADCYSSMSGFLRDNKLTPPPFKL